MALRQVITGALLSMGLIVPATAQDLSMSPVEQAKLSQPSDQAAERSLTVLRVQVLLDGTHFSPDVIDGYLRQQLLPSYRGFRAAPTHAAGRHVVVFPSALSRRAGWHR